jgi:hypothetical protein
VKEQNEVNVSNKFAALENVNDNVDISGAWESIRVSKLQPKIF